MTEHHPDDEALSAVVDGAGNDADTAHLDRCPACQGRLNELRAVSHAVGAAVATRPAAEIDAAVGRALAEVRDRPVWPPRPATGRPSGAPARSLRWQPRGARVLAIAAAVVVVAGIASVIAVTTNHRATPHNSATSATTASPAPTVAAAAAGASAGSPSGPAPQGAAAASPPDLGDQSDPASLAATLRSLEQQNRAGSAATILSPPPCATTAASGAGLQSDARALVALPLRWRGQDAQVLVFALSTAAGGQTAVVVAAASCAVLTSFAV